MNCLLYTSQKFQLNLVQSIVESILNDTPYPLTLQQACTSRIPQILRQKSNKEKKGYKKRFDLSVAILKAVSYTHLPLLNVQIIYPGASPSEVENSLTQKAEEVLSSMEGCLLYTSRCV